MNSATDRLIFIQDLRGKDDVALSKAAIIERCIRRIHQEYRFDPHLQSDTHVDALTLNIERACQAAIDLAMHVVAIQRLGLPKNSANAFALLQKAGLLSADLAEKLKRMTGFRNVAVNEYQEIDTNISRPEFESNCYTENRRVTR